MAKQESIEEQLAQTFLLVLSLCLEPQVGKLAGDTRFLRLIGSLDR